jgi:hypothetical protein
VVQTNSVNRPFWHVGLNEESIEERTLDLFFTMTTVHSGRRRIKKISD